MRKGFTRKPKPDEPATRAKNYITPSGLERLKDEHRFLLTRERPAVTEVVAWAASNGDRSENADYRYGKRRLRQIDGRIRFLTKRIEAAEVVDPEAPRAALPKSPSEIFCYFILHRMPTGLRGLLIAGIFATAMGSLSTALNALATSFTRDWYQTYVNRGATQRESLRAVRLATVAFSVLMIVVASLTSYIVILHPNIRIIPIVLGIYGYTYGPLLGVFLCGIFTKRRGSNRGNIIAMISGFIGVAIVSNLCNAVAGLFGGVAYAVPWWLPKTEFPWWICFGTIVTFLVALFFKTTAQNMEYKYAD